VDHFFYTSHPLFEAEVAGLWITPGYRPKREKIFAFQGRGA